MSVKVWPAKVGTQPALIVLRYRYKLDVGQRIEYRDYDSRQWGHGIVTNVRPDILFLDKM